MLKTKLTLERLRDFFMSLFLILSCICLICVMVGFFKMFFPYVNATEWDLLAFVGSLIAAIITVMAIRVPLRAQRNEQKRVQYQTLLKELHSAKKKTRGVLLLPNQPIKDIENDIFKSQTLRFRSDIIHNYIVDVTKLVDNLVSVMDWEVYEEIENKLRPFVKFEEYYEKIDNYITPNYISDIFVLQIEDYYEQTKTLESYLSDYFDEIQKKYKHITKRPKFSLFE